MSNSFPKIKSFVQVVSNICQKLLNFNRFRRRSTDVSCYYYEAIPNFGDLLNINLFNYFGKKIKNTSIKNSEVMAIGSLLQVLFREKKLSKRKRFLLLFKKKLVVCGSGFIKDIPITFTLLRRLDVRAVRGYISLEKLRKFKNVSIAPNVVIGDPGLLSKYIVDTSNIQKKYELGIVPHFVDKDSLLLSNINVKNSVVIDIQQSPEIFLKKIAECKNIISSAMHGLIAADSLRIPNIRMVLSDKIVGGDYKFNDYYSAFGIKEHNVIDLNKRKFFDEDVVGISKNYMIKTEQVDEICQRLLKMFAEM